MTKDSAEYRDTRSIYYALALHLFALMLVMCELCVHAAEIDWQLGSHRKVPETFPAPDFGATDLVSLYFQGPQWRGKSTRVFAYYGLPNGATAERPVPGVVCVHGGGGTAFAGWVKLWNERGYAAIALDTNGAVPEDIQQNPDTNRHEWAGPSRYGFNQVSDSPQNHWNYHAVAAVIRANSLLRSMPEVDEENVGITGISWGSYKSCITIGLDPRFKFAVLVYGCGFLHEGSTWTDAIDQYGRDEWLAHWDPSSYLANAELPTLWINGTNDQHYYLPNFQKSYRLCSDRSLCIPIRMDHGHGSGWEREEIYAFAQWAVGRSQQPLTEIVHSGTRDNRAWIQYESPSEISISETRLNYTSDSGAWRERFWETKPAVVDGASHRVTAEIPTAATAYYFQLVDSRGLMVSSEHVVRSGKN